MVLLAVASGAAVANLYYPQPLLHTLAGAFRVSNGLAGLLITVTQIGYVVGLALLVPLGDLLERRRLITSTLCVTVVAQGLASPYRQLLGSVLALVRDEPVLRQRMALGAAGFGCFSVLWTSLAFLLSGAPYHYGDIVIGLFGLAGVAGASVAPLAGRLVDRGHGRAATSAGLTVLLASWGVLALGKDSVSAMLIGIVLLDLGVQGLHITNQSTIYALRPEARSRLTTAYMVANFLGGALLSALTSAFYSSDGWAGVCTLGVVTTALGIAVWLVATLRRRTDMRARRRAGLDPALSHQPGTPTDRPWADR